MDVPLGLVLGAAGALALLLLWLSAWLGQRTGLSSVAEVVASDTSQGRVKKLRDPATGLVGQPDYILRERVGLVKRLVPVEVKPTRRGHTLYESDEMQLVVYLLLLRSAYGRQAARYGYVRYRDQTFRVELTQERIQRCLAYANEIRQVRYAADVDRSHDLLGRCASCALRTACGRPARR